MAVERFLTDDNQTPLPRFIIRQTELLKELRVSRRGLEAMIRDEGFPKPVRLVGRHRGWRVDEVTAWVETRPRA